jgi:alpha-glucoside transport system permease protein
MTVASHMVLASTLSDSGSRLLGVIESVGGFLAILLILFVVVGKVTGRLERPVTVLICLVPAVVLAIVGLVIPSVITVISSLQNTAAAGQKFTLVDGKLVPIKAQWVGLQNYGFAFTDSYTRGTLVRTVEWIILVPLVTVFIGLLLALLMDSMKRVSLAKTLIFLPTAISFVGAALIWEYVYNPPVMNGNGTPGAQNGLLSQIAIALGWKHPPNWIIDSPLNTYLLMVILVWIEVGFAMVVLGAALKAIPEEILEAARMDGATGVTLFRTVQIPMIRNTLIVVLTTITIATLKTFDIVYTVTNGNYNTDILARQMYADLFVTNQTGKGSALAVILFLCVVPLVIYNISQLRKDRATR